ncbi:MAG: four helix bundle protein, partial [Planctomyces sp.]|nr:four helix bundle protein [Planctomyces sp.]
IVYTASVYNNCLSLGGLHRHSRDQWIRAVQSIPLNIAEGNGKRSAKERARYFDIARGSAFECAAIQDVLVATNGIELSRSDDLKKTLKRIVSMLTRLTIQSETIS